MNPDRLLIKMKRPFINWFAAIVGFAWGGIVIGWWIAYPLGYRTAVEECRGGGYETFE